MIGCARSTHPDGVATTTNWLTAESFAALVAMETGGELTLVVRMAVLADLVAGPATGEREHALAEPLEVA